jgi:hypothetical protein
MGGERQGQPAPLSTLNHAKSYRQHRYRCSGPHHPPGGLTVGPRTTLAAVAVLLLMVGSLGYSLGCDAVRMMDRATTVRAGLVVLPP